jgi:hypothetical protein
METVANFHQCFQIGSESNRQLPGSWQPFHHLRYPRPIHTKYTPMHIYQALFCLTCFVSTHKSAFQQHVAQCTCAYGYAYRILVFWDANLCRWINGFRLVEETFRLIKTTKPLFMQFVLLNKKATRSLATQRRRWYRIRSEPHMLNVTHCLRNVCLRLKLTLLPCSGKKWHYSDRLLDIFIFTRVTAVGIDPGIQTVPTRNQTAVGMATSLLKR